MIKHLYENLDAKKVGVLLGIFVCVALLWGTVAVTPIKLLVVLLHEISHGLAAVLTGGSISTIEVNANQGGVCYTVGGSRWFTLSAGYLGSMLWGGAILIAASRTKVDRGLSVAMGLFLLTISALYIRNGFGLALGIGFGLVMVGMGAKLSHKVNEFVLQTIGLTSCLYAVLDILDDVLKRPGVGSDADMLAEITTVPGVVWGVIWIVLAIVASAFALVISAQRE